ncbi:MAG: hypothetical protein CVU90_09265 [Firmicutes bacterium HGW-Firmicutes-15]|nr:MAG: hypothetical protein CVU90_09265 [Firmicutes bacterium HGW-Firmicutes-15]
MNILFLGTTGIHHTLIAAHLYLGKPEPNNYRDIQFWGDRSSEALGYPIFLDNDEQSNGVYSLGVGRDVLMAAKSIKQLVEILNCTERDLMIKPVFIKRERILLFLHRIGRVKIVHYLVIPIIAYLIKNELTGICEQVEELKSQFRFT